MRILLLHADFMQFECVKEVKVPFRDPAKKERVEEVLVVFTAAEKGDTEDKIDQTVEEVLKVADQIKAPRVLIYPFVHLTENPASAKDALESVHQLKDKMSEKIETHYSAFGWYKSFNIKVKGHPLAELSRRL